MSLTLAFITARRNSRFKEWFLPSLAAQTDDGPPIIKIDRYAEMATVESNLGFEVLVHPPKPSVWSGPHRLTKENWFDVANARNTALCLCRTSHILFMDDLTVLMPGFWNAAKEAVSDFPNHITIGAYQKVTNLVVKDGLAVSYDQPESGKDNRLSIMQGDHGPCEGGWMYGYALMPIEAILSVDGYCESLSGGLGFEDVLTGIVLANAGHHMRYDKRLFAIESEEAHQEEPADRKESWSKGPDDRDDKAWRALNIAKQSKAFDNGFGPGGIRALRNDVLSGGDFPIKGTPQHCWFLGVQLEDL